MRDIKFRAWHRTNSVMFANKDISVLAKNINNDGGFVYMQYTGLKDKNGKEIYEGDIVKRVGYLASNIWFEDGTYLFGIKDLYDEHFYQMIADECEVIGNIYENPELLNQNQ